MALFLSDPDYFPQLLDRERRTMNYKYNLIFKKIVSLSADEPSQSIESRRLSHYRHRLLQHFLLKTN